MTDPTIPDRPQAPPRTDRGGWISGPSSEAIALFTEIYGDRWQLEVGDGVLAAVKRPTPTTYPLHIVVAESIGELTVKVEAAESESQS